MTELTRQEKRQELDDMKKTFDEYMADVDSGVKILDPELVEAFKKETSNLEKEL